MGNKSCRSSPDLTHSLNNLIQETFACFWGGKIGLFIFAYQMQCLCGFLLGQNRRSQNTIPSFSAVLIRSSNWCIWALGFSSYQVNSTQRICDSSEWHARAQRCLPGTDGVCQLWDNTCACREQTQQTLVGTGGHTRALQRHRWLLWTGIKLGEVESTAEQFAEV